MFLASSVGHTTSDLPEMDRIRDESAIFEDFFVCATSPSLSASGSSMERIQKLVLVGSAITRKELPWTTLATLVTASCGDFGILRVDDSQAILGQCTGCRALAECAGVDYFVGPLVGAAAKSGPIMSWCQSFVLVWLCCRSCEGFSRDGQIAAAIVLDRGRLVKSSPGRALFSNDEGAAPYLSGDKFTFNSASRSCNVC